MNEEMSTKIIDALEAQISAALEDAVESIATLREHHDIHPVPRGYSRSAADLEKYECCQEMARLMRSGVFSEDGLETEEQEVLNEALTQIHRIL